jgi:hypothetical protein
MRRALDQFDQNIVRVRTLGGLHQALATLTTPAVDATDVLRAQIVMAVSALDHYVHEVTLLGMLEVFTGVRPATPAYARFEVPVGTAVSGVANGGTAWFEAVVREKHGSLSFQHPDKVAAAIRLFSPCELWPTLALALGRSAEALKTQLRLIVDRRNMIAHEADLDPSYPGVHWPISPAVASGVTDVVEEVCQAIHAAVV